MGEFRFTAKITADIRVSAGSEAAARVLLIDHLNDADTEFIRSDYWFDLPMVAEFHVDDLTSRGTSHDR